MRTQTSRTFSTEFKLEVTQLVVEQNYSVREAADAMNVEKWVQLPVGWAHPNSPNSDLIAAALPLAFESRGGPQNVRLHSDQGCHYTSRKSRQYIWRCQMKQSMSRRGNYWDNAPVEQFFRSLKTELLPQTGYRTLAEAKKAITNYIIAYYRHVRPHAHNAGKAISDRRSLGDLNFIESAIATVGNRR